MEVVVEWVKLEDVLGKTVYAHSQMVYYAARPRACRIYEHVTLNMSQAPPARHHPRAPPAQEAAMPVLRKMVLA
ncbi:MAG: hypothetical protein WCG85_24715 [Polyangia bacterium]